MGRYTVSSTMEKLWYALKIETRAEVLHARNLQLIAYLNVNICSLIPQLEELITSMLLVCWFDFCWILKFLMSKFSWTKTLFYESKDKDDSEHLQCHLFLAFNDDSACIGLRCNEITLLSQILTQNPVYTVQDVLKPRTGTTASRCIGSLSNLGRL